MSDPELDARALGSLLRASAEQSAPKGWIDAGAERLRAEQPRRAAKLAPHSRRFVWMAAAAVALAAIVWWRASMPTAVTFDVAKSAQASSDYVVARGGAPADLRFSDGTHVRLAPESRLRVVARTELGARLLLEQGAVELDVVRRPGGAWTVIAGPFEVHVTGTRFAVTWDTHLEDLAVLVLEGSVRVSGPGLDRGADVRAGQRLRANARGATWSLAPASNGAPAPANAKASSESSQSEATADNDSATVESARAQPEAPSRSPIEASKSAKPPPAPSSNWPAAIARGDFDLVLRAAEDRGIERCLTSSSARDLEALADAARYTRRWELAERTLLALHERPATERGRTTYLLGAVNEARGKARDALGWYERYLNGPGTHTFVAEAKAGRLRMLSKVGDHARARSAAIEYLAEFPDGVGAVTARRILESR